MFGSAPDGADAFGAGVGFDGAATGGAGGFAGGASLHAVSAIAQATATVSEAVGVNRMFVFMGGAPIDSYDSDRMRTAAEPLALVNARVLTVDRARPTASSAVLRGGRIEAVDRVASDVRSVDLDGAVVVPGFVDSHLHLELGGASLLHLDLSTATTRAQFEAAIARRHAELPPNEWLIARGWNEDALAEGTPPSRAWLTAAGRRPAVCWRSDQHACVVNDAALEVVSKRHDLSADPPGGRIRRDAAGRPDGLFQEAAAWQLVQPCVPAPSLDATRRAVRAAQSHLARLGITTVGSMEYGETLREAIAPQRADLDVRMRVTLLDRAWPDEFERWLAYAVAFDGDDALAIVGMKAFVDGTLGSRTARMLEPYADDPGNRGLFVELAERGLLNAWALRVADAGLSPSMHAIGDEAARAALDALEACAARHPAIAVRIEHAQTIAPEDVPRFRGRFASMQPLHKAHDARSAASRLGARRMDRFFPFRALLDHGARLAFGSDWPIVSADPIAGMAAAITGRDLDGRVVRAEENIGPEAALRAYTSEASACLGLRGAGAIRVGALADLTVLDRDPLECNWDHERPQVLATLMGGRPTYVAPQLAGAL